MEIFTDEKAGSFELQPLHPIQIYILINSSFSIWMVSLNPHNISFQNKPTEMAVGILSETKTITPIQLLLEAWLLNRTRLLRSRKRHLQLRPSFQPP